MRLVKISNSLILASFLYATTSFAGLALKDEAVLQVQSKNVFLAPAPYYWTGFYGGINVGGRKHTMDVTDNNASSFAATIREAANPSYAYGLQIGYRRQLALMPASGVYGVEASLHFANATFHKQYGSPYALYQLDAKNSLQKWGLLQLIAGLSADRALLFLAGGLAVTDIDGKLQNLDGIPFFNTTHFNKISVGTAAGVGVEYAYSELISLRVKVDVITPNVYSHTSATGERFQIANHIVQAVIALNYKFA